MLSRNKFLLLVSNYLPLTTRRDGEYGSLNLWVCFQDARAIPSEVFQDLTDWSLEQCAAEWVEWRVTKATQIRPSWLPLTSLEQDRLRFDQHDL